MKVRIFWLLKYNEDIYLIFQKMFTFTEACITFVFLTVQLAFGAEWLETINNVTLSVQHKSGEIFKQETILELELNVSKYKTNSR